MSTYPLIADHGLIGNLQTAALVATDGTIDWFCAPRFDSPSIFGSLLDDDRGGHFKIKPTADTFTRRQLYYPDTAILVTRFLTDAGVGEVVFEGAKTALSLSIVREPEDERLARYHMSSEGDLHAELTLVAGQSRGVI